MFLGVEMAVLVAAADKLGMKESAMRDATAMASQARVEQPGAFADACVREIARGC